MDVSDLKKQLDELEKERKKLQGQAEDMKKKEKVSIFPSQILKQRNTYIEIHISFTVDAMECRYNQSTGIFEDGGQQYGAEESRRTD